MDLRMDFKARQLARKIQSTLENTLTDQRVKALRLFLLLVFILFFGTIGYMLLEGWDWFDSLYMTIITITTVGYGEVRNLDTLGRLFTMTLVFVSLGVVAYAASTITSMVVETQFSSIFWRRRMEQKIKDIKDHYIICGYGRTGRGVTEALSQVGSEFVVVERRPEGLVDLKERGRLFVEGDANDDDSLISAGIERAKGLVAALGNDAENIYVVLSGRMLNPNLTIVSWASSQEAEKKIRRAGADHVLSPYVLGGKRIATLLTAPHALEFFDHAMGGTGTDQNIRLCELTIGGKSPLVGNSLIGLGIRRDIDVIVIGVRRATGEMLFNPPAQTEFQENDILIGIGSQDQLNKFQDFLS